MTWLKLCAGDKLVDTLIEVFNANIVRVPEARIQPLAVVASRGDQSSFRGALPPLLNSSVSEFPPLTIEQSRMADLSGKHSRRVEIGSGLEILDGFLRGFGVPGAALRQQFDGAAEVSFCFREVNRKFIDTNQLGRTLRNRYIDPNNPAAAIFFGSKPYDLLLIDSVITSREFTIQIERKQTTEFELDIPAIQDLIAKADIEITVESASGLDLSFAGQQALSFAFTCLRFLLDDDGLIIALPSVEGVTHQFGRLYATIDRVRLSREPAMLEWED